MPWYLHLLIDDEKTRRHKFFNEKTRGQKRGKIFRAFNAATTFQFSSEGLSRTEERTKGSLNPLFFQIPGLSIVHSSSPTASLGERERERERERKRRSLFSPPFRGRIIVAWKFINRDNKQDPANDPFFFHPLSRMEYRFLYLQFSPRVEKKKMEAKKNWSRKRIS